MRFWKQHREDQPIEQLLRANRAVPRDEFVASQLDRLNVQRQRPRPQRVGHRVLIATAVTVLVVGAGTAAGATHVVGTSISNLVHVAKSANHASNGSGNSQQPASGTKGDEKNSSPSAADDQYTVPVCHHTGSKKHPWHEIFVSPQGAANLVKHHPPDYIVGAPGNPTTCPP